MTNLDQLHARVAAPATVPHPFGLFSVVQPASPSDHVLVGVSWESWGCVTANVTTDACITDTDGGPKDFVRHCEWESFKPFTVYLGIERNGQSLDVGSQQVARVLGNSDELAVENELWAMLGATPAAPALSPEAALASVEAALGNGYMGTGVIHMGRDTAIRLSDKLFREGGRLETRLGTPVVVGAGYDGTAIYGTGALAAWRDEMVVYTAWDMSINDELVLAERTYVVGWDCFVTGTLVTPAT